MTLQEQFYTVEQFEAFVNLPENADKLFEFIGGEIVEVPSNPYASKIASLINLYIGMYLLEQDIGHLTGEAGGYQVGMERYAPDVAFISYEKQPKLAESGYNPNPPDLAVEVVSSDSRTENDKLTIKLGHYLAADVMVWIVRPEIEQIEVHMQGERPKVYRKGDTLEGGAVLPGFKLEVSKVFK